WTAPIGASSFTVERSADNFTTVEKTYSSVGSSPMSDTTLQSGKKYYYRVTAQTADVTVVESGSANVSLTVNGTTRLLAPTSFNNSAPQTTGGVSTVPLTWTNSAGHGNTVSYVVQRASMTTQGGTTCSTFAVPAN